MERAAERAATTTDQVMSVATDPESPGPASSGICAAEPEMAPAPTRPLARYVIYVMYILSSSALALPMTPLYAFLSQVLRASPAQISSYYATIFIPTFFKVIYGYLSDTYPILGYRRRPWIMIYGALQTVLYLVYASFVRSYAFALAVGFMLNVSMAGYEICIDSMVVEISKRASIEHSYQSNCMMIRWSGTLLCTLLSLLLLKYNVSFQTIAYVTSSTGVLLALCAYLIPEHVEDYKNLNYLQMLKVIFRSVFTGREDSAPLWPVLVFLFLTKCTPTSANIMYDYMMTVASFESWLINLINLSSSVTSILGIAAYKLLFKRTALWKVFLLTTALNCVTSLTQVVITTDAYKYLHIPLFPLALADECLVNASYQMSYMPVLVLTTLICPLGLEAGIWALFLSVADLASSISGYLTTALLLMLHVDKSDYSNFWKVITICQVIKLLPLVLIPWIREHLQGNSAEIAQSTNAESEVPKPIDEPLLAAEEGVAPGPVPRAVPLEVLMP